MSKFRTLRRAEGITQEQAAYALGENRSTVAMWEIGKSMPQASKLPAIAKLYNCTVDELLKDERKEGEHVTRKRSLP